ncbi:MAG: protein-disulfide reductase DsbD domain-containing protein [Hyphomicrobiales bacterium]
MNRRSAILSCLALPLIAGAAGAGLKSHYRVSLIAGGYTGGRHLAGVQVGLDRLWKTYWRMPGDAGIPPRFDWSGSQNLAAIELSYPLPRRYRDAAGETVGYKDRVVFPALVTPLDKAEPVRLHLDLFFAVCDVICIPAKAAAGVDLGLASADPAAAALIAEWRQRVPRPVAAGAAQPVIQAIAATEAGKPVLLLELAQRFDDIFVESAITAYFRKPEFSPDGSGARLPVDGLKEAAALKGARLDLTLARGATGLEQAVIVI